jgi:outer membrane receptor protein involved in Fe transport
VAQPGLAQTGAGVLEGAVPDADGGALPGVTVTLTNTATGYSRVAPTGADGRFRFAAVPIGDYQVRFELSGFSTLTQEGVTINVGTTRDLDVTLQVASVEEAITVTTEAPLIRTEPSIGTVVSQEELENLPLNGRQFANLAILAPGTTLAYNSDPTKPGQLQVQLAGGIGRNVNYIMDGGDNTDDTIGGALQNFNLESVAEFNIQTQLYKAEYGRSSGGVLSVVTKTGTNDFAGTVWGYFRDDSLNSKTETERLGGVDKQAYERQQYGLALGGPIVRDKAHFFATFERTDRETNYTVTPTDENGNPIFPEFFGTVVALPFKDDLATAKLTWDINAKQYLQVRYGYQKNEDKYGASPLAAPSSLGTLTNEYESVLLGHTAQLGSDRLNEFVFQYTTFDNVILPDAAGQPLIYYPSSFHTGENLNTPQATSQKKYQFRDDFTWSSTLWGKRHDFKVGANYVDEPTLGGDFSTGTAGQYFATDDLVGSPIFFIQVFGGFFGEEEPNDQYGAYIQDDWSVNDRLTLSLGLRYDYFDLYDQIDQRTNPIWQVLNAQRTFNEPYLRDLQNDDGVLDNDDDNLAPRLGFAWDIKGDGRRILRGGYGTFYDFPYTNATILFPAAAIQSNYGVAFEHNNPDGIRNPDGSLFQPGQPLCLGPSPPANCLPNQLPGLGSFPPNEVASPTLATPYSDQASLGYSWQVNDWLGLNFEAMTIDYHDIPFRFRANPGVDANGNGVFEPALGETRRFPQFANFRLWYGGGRASYDAFNVSARLRFPKWELQGFYTWSEAEGNVLAGADEFRLTDAGAQSDVGGGARADQSVNPLDPLCDACFGPLYTDARHRLTLSGIYRAPWGITVSSLLRYRSALPYLEHNNADLNGDIFPIDLRPGVSHVNSGRGFEFTQIDVRVSKEFTFGDVKLELLAEMFNILNDENPGRPNRFGEATAFAGDPLQGEQQLIQLGVRVRYR